MAFYCKSRILIQVDPEEIFKEEIKQLEKRFNIVDNINLSPFEKDHILIIATLR